MNNGLPLDVAMAAAVHEMFSLEPQPPSPTYTSGASGAGGAMECVSGENEGCDEGGGNPEDDEGGGESGDAGVGAGGEGGDGGPLVTSATAISAAGADFPRPPQRGPPLSERRFGCPVTACKYRAPTRGRLKTHSLTHSQPEAKYHCSCGFSSVQVGNLKAHKLTHTREKLFVCDIEGCKYAAVRRGNLQRHALTHSDAKPFVCEAQGCLFRTQWEANLVTHRMRHTGEKPYVCLNEGCNFASAWSSLLCKHRRVVHGAEITQRKRYRADPSALSLRSLAVPAPMTSISARAAVPPVAPSQPTPTWQMEAKAGASKGGRVAGGFLPHGLDVTSLRLLDSAPVAEARGRALLALSAMATTGGRVMMGSGPPYVGAHALSFVSYILTSVTFKAPSPVQVPEPMLAVTPAPQVTPAAQAIQHLAAGV